MTKKQIERIWYPTIGKRLILEKAHIHYAGRLLCNKAINIAISEAGGDGGKLLIGCASYTKMCPDCEKIYKEDSRFPYKKWTGV